MASVNKKFGIEKGLEVGTDALVVDADNNRTGVGKTDAKYGLDVATVSYTHLTLPTTIEV